MRLIDGDRLEDVIEDECFNYVSDNDFNVGIQNGLLLARDYVQEAPTIDAFQVVRCKDCKHNWVTSYNHGVQDEPRCKFTNYKFGLDDYCSRGERREE